MSDGWTCRPIEARDTAQWDNFCASSDNATFLHTQRYVRHQRNRYIDRSLLYFLNGELQAILPAVSDRNQSSTVTSRLGLPYGGLLHRNKIYGSVSIAAFRQAFEIWRQLECINFLYTPVPYIFQNTYAADDEFALQSLGAHISDCKLSSVLDLLSPIKFSSRKRRNLKRSSGLQVSQGMRYLPDFHRILATNLRNRYAVRPTHSLSELTELMNNFPDQIRLYISKNELRLLAGVLIFDTGSVWHCQYIAGDDQARKIGAVDFLLANLIEQARQKQVRFFNFGVSNEPQTGDINDGLFQSKHEFGARSHLHRTWQLAL